MNALNLRLADVARIVKQQSPWTTALATSGTFLVAFSIIAYIDYCDYVAMGPHGLPDTFGGWVKQLKMNKYARKDTTAPAPWGDVSAGAAKLGPNANRSFLAKPLPAREKTRPLVCRFVAPQRQLAETATSERKRQMSSYLDSLADQNPTLLTRGLSRLEGPVPAVQLHGSKQVPSYLKVTSGEILHVHPPDGSTHLVLSLADSQSVIEKGWGQRHRLSGGLLQWSYTLVYAPVTTEEFEVWQTIVATAIGFSTAEVGEVNTLRQGIGC